MKLAMCVLLIAASFNIFNPAVIALEENSIFINEVSVGNSISASYEYVEIVNTAAVDIDISGWKIEYLSAQGTKWITKAIFDTTIRAKDTFLAATSDTQLNVDASLSSGLAATGGHVRLVSVDGTEIDRLGWGSATEPEQVAAAQPSDEYVLKRIVNEDGIPIDSNNNSTDFILSSNPTPTKSRLGIACDVELPEPSEEHTPPEKDSTQTEDDNKENTYYPPLRITELLIDPESPATDKEDEYVEIHNPNPFAVNLYGYTIEAGSDFRYSYVMSSYELKPNEYIAIFSIDSKLTLPNSGGMVRLVDPNGVEISLTSAYTKAKLGKSWSLDNYMSWSWTIPSPHAENVFGEENDSPTEKNKVLSVLSKRTPKVAGSDRGKEDVQEARTLTDKENSFEPPAQATKKINSSVLVVGLVIAVLYGGYEYRQDIANLYSKLRRNVQFRGKNSQKL